MKKRDQKKSIFQLLTEKPWEKGSNRIDNEHEGKTVNLSKQKLGLRTIMVVSTVLFSLFIVVFRSYVGPAIGKICQNHGSLVKYWNSYFK